MAALALALAMNSSQKNKSGHKNKNHSRAKSHKKADPAGEKKEEKGPNPVLSKARAGMYPFYPEEFNVTTEGKPMMMMTQDQQGESLLNRHDLDFEEKCNIKQGYLANVISSTENKAMKKQLITARPAFVVLNKKTLTLFANENVKSLLNSYPLFNLRTQSVPIDWDSTFCWQVMKQQGDSTDKITMKNPAAPELNTTNLVVTLCASDDAERQAWMHAIDTFQKCEVREITTVATEGPNFVRTIKDEDEEVEEQRKNADDEQILEISNSLNAIDDQVKAHLNTIQKATKENEEEQQKEDEVVEELEDKNNCLQNQLIEEAKKSEEGVEFAMQKEVTEGIEKTAQKDTLSEEYNNRLYRILQHKNSLIKEKKKVAQSLMEQMMQKASSVEKNLDSGSCYDENIFKKGPVQMKAVCHEIYKDHGVSLVIKDLLDCLNPATFCLACCSNFIGAGHMERRQSCVDQCDGILTKSAKATGLNLKVITDNAQTASELQYTDVQKDEDDEDKKN